MKVGVTSKNAIKLDAVRSVYPEAEISGYSSDSGVGEQPVDDQTLEGARNRIQSIPYEGLDLIISIENGIFDVQDTKGNHTQWEDIACVVVYEPATNTEKVAYSNPVVFPDKYVEKARQIGFDKITVGKVMADAGFIEFPKDPHLSISGKPRIDYLVETLQKLI